MTPKLRVIFLFPGQKNAGQEPAFFIDSFTVYGLSLSVLRSLFSRLRLFGSRWGRRRWCRPRPEVNRGRRLAPRSSLEVRPRLGPDHLRGYRLWKGPDVGVVCLNRLIVVVPRSRDPILGSGQLILKTQEPLICLELRICLRDREQPAERPSELTVGGRHLLGVASLNRPRQTRSCLSDLREHSFLVLRITLHSIDEIRHQVRPA